MDVCNIFIHISAPILSPPTTTGTVLFFTHRGNMQVLYLNRNSHLLGKNRLFFSSKGFCAMSWSSPLKIKTECLPILVVYLNLLRKCALIRQHGQRLTTLVCAHLMNVCLRSTMHLQAFVFLMNSATI